jgi:hypothetical protein
VHRHGAAQLRNGGADTLAMKNTMVDECWWVISKFIGNYNILYIYIYIYMYIIITLGQDIIMTTLADWGWWHISHKETYQPMRWERTGSDSEEPVSQSTMVIRPAKGGVC